MDLEELVATYIHARCGWAHESQVRDTLHDYTTFGEQNDNALRDIKDELEALVYSGLLNSNAEDTLKSYLEALESYLDREEEDDGDEE